MPVNDDVVSLIRFLRDVARARHDPVRDVHRYEQVHWLAGLPGQITVNTAATRGEVLFGVPETLLDPPAAAEEFDGWLSVRRWHRTLRGLAEKQGAEYELVLATGLLDSDFGDVHVRNHLLVTPVRIVIDPATERADVVLLDRPAALQDRALLDELPGFRPERTGWIRDGIRTGQGYGLQSSVADVLRNWCSAAFDDPPECSNDWAPGDTRQPGAPPSVRFAPALVLRVADRAAVRDFYDAVMGRLTGAGGGAPVVAKGMARLIDPTPEPRATYIRERSPQIIADLVTSLLARGRKVLIATPGPHGRTLAALRAALPPPLAPLCTGPAQVEECTAALTKRFSAYDPDKHEQTVADLMSRLSMMQGIIHDLQERIAAARSGERYDIAPGYRGTLAEITERLVREEPACSWMPLDDDLPRDPRLTAGEAARLLQLLAEQTPQRIARTKQVLPPPEALPSVERIRTLVAQEQAGPPALDPRIRLCEAEPDLLARLQECSAAVTAALRSLALPADPADWDHGDWVIRAIDDALAHRGQEQWRPSARASDSIATAERLVRSVGGREVILPAGDESQLLAAARQARERLTGETGPGSATAGGVGGAGAGRRSVRRPQGPSRGAQRLLGAARVDGEPPATEAALDAVIATIEGRAICRELALRWAAAGVPSVQLPSEHSLDQAVQWFTDAAQRLHVVRAMLPAVEEAGELLTRAGLPAGAAGGGRRLIAVLTGLPARLTAERAGSELDSLRSDIEAEIERADSVAQEAPELHEAIAAISSRDPVTYGKCVVALATAHRERAQQARCEELLERLREAHPALAALMTARSGDEVWKRRLELWNDAWYWAYASVFVARRPRSEMEQRLDASLAEAYSTQARHAATLTVELAWGWCMSRMKTRPASAVLPVWVMPIWQIVESIAPDPDRFDVVIMDETAQEGVEALFLLWLAPQVIMVGGGEPRPIPHVDVEPLPGPLGEVITPDSTVFSVLARRMGPILEPDAQAGAGGGAAAGAMPPDEPATTAPPPPVDLPLRPGLSIASYQRSELMELVARLADSGASLTDDELLEHARTLLDGPEEERLFAAARLRYALDLLRGSVHA